MLHNEARELLARGYEATHDAEGIARTYSVSQRTVFRLVSQKRKTGSVAVQTRQRGRKSALTSEDREHIRQCMDKQPDMTIEEIWEELRLSASCSTVERAIEAMGYTLKKKSLHASERDRVRCEGKAQGMAGNNHGNQFLENGNSRWFKLSLLIACLFGLRGESSIIWEILHCNRSHLHELGNLWIKIDFRVAEVYVLAFWGEIC